MTVKDRIAVISVGFLILMISTCTGEVLIFIVRVTLYSRKLLRDRETFHDIHGLGAKSIATPTYVLESSNQ